MSKGTATSITCAGCGEEFVPHHRAAGRQKYCGIQCQKRSWERAKARPNRVGSKDACGVCRESFEVRHVAQIYCSASCKRAAARAKVPQRWRHASSRYGITPDQFQGMLSSQGGGCAICKVPLAGHRRDRDAPQVDHDHATGKVREILCRLCNTALGNFRDDPALVRSALAYLERWRLTPSG